MKRLLTVRIEEILLKHFKIKCIEKETDMSAVVLALIEKWITLP